MKINLYSADLVRLWPRHVLVWSLSTWWLFIGVYLSDLRKRLQGSSVSWLCCTSSTSTRGRSILSGKRFNWLWPTKIFLKLPLQNNLREREREEPRARVCVWLNHTQATQWTVPSLLHYKYRQKKLYRLNALSKSL